MTREPPIPAPSGALRVSGAEPDDDRDLLPTDEPLHGRLRGERDGFIRVYRRPFVLVTYKGGKPVRVQTVIAERRG